MHEYDVGRLDGDVGARADGDAYVSTGERRRVVDAVSNHRDPVTLPLEVVDESVLLVGKDARDDLVHAHLVGDGACGPLLVAREHHGSYAQLAQAGDGILRRRLHGVGYCDHAEGTAISRKEERRLGLGGYGVGMGVKRAERDALGLHEAGVSREGKAAIDRCPEATPGNLLEVRDRDAVVGAGASFVYVGADGLGERMLTSALERGGHTKELALFHLASGYDVGHAGLALGDGARLVQDDGVQLAGGLERLGTLDENTKLGSALGAYHNGGRRGEPQGAGAGDHEYDNGVVEGHREVARCEERNPRDEGHGRDADDGGDEDTRDPVGHTLDGGLRAGGLVHEADDVGERGVVTHGRGSHGYPTTLGHGGACDRVAHALLHGDGLAGDGRLVYGGRALHHPAIHGHGLSRTHDHALSHPDVLGGNLDLLSLADHGRGLGGKIHEGADGACRLALGARLKVLAQRDEHEDGAGRVKVEAVHHGVVRRLQVCHAQGEGHLVDAHEAVGVRCRRAYGDERVHVGCQVDKGREAPDKVLPVDKEHAGREQKLRHGRGHHALHAS